MVFHIYSCQHVRINVTWALYLQGSRERLFADDFRKPEVSKLDMQVFVSQEDVLRFDVAVNNVTLVLERLAS